MFRLYHLDHSVVHYWYPYLVVAEVVRLPSFTNQPLVVSSPPRGGVMRARCINASPSGAPCGDCGVKLSPLWRSVSYRGDRRHLCNACGLRYKKGQFCPFCEKTYKEIELHPEVWEECEECHETCAHIKCIEKNDIQRGNYTCKRCREKRQG